MHWIAMLSDWVWGVPAMALLLAVGICMSITTRFVQVRKLGASLRQVGWSLRRPSGGVSSFQAVCTALAATVGTGNIAGVAGAIALGGPGAGVGTAITCWLLFGAFSLMVLHLKVFREFHVFRRAGFSLRHIREHLRIGIPMGLAIFLETSFFGVECLLVSRFGTIVVAANQAAMSFCNMLYMVPLSFSLSLTILVGAYVGAKDFAQAKAYADTGRISNILIGACFGLLLFLGRGLIATLYTEDAALMAPIMHFLTFAVAFQFFDSTAAPIQGVLRGYKDVKATFYSALASYWGIALPFGLFLDHGLGKGPDGYWIGLITGIFFSATFLSLRLRYMEKKSQVSSL